MKTLNTLVCMEQVPLKEYELAKETNSLMLGWQEKILNNMNLSTF